MEQSVNVQATLDTLGMTASDGIDPTGAADIIEQACVVLEEIRVGIASQRYDGGEVGLRYTELKLRTAIADAVRYWMCQDAFFVERLLGLE